MDMRNSFKSSVAGILCVAVAVTAFAGNAWAGPVNVASSAVVKSPSLMEQIYYRRYHHRHYGGYYRRGYGRGYYYGYPGYGYGYPAYGYPAYGYGYPYRYGW